jgi:uncharacterized membrane protein SirB2
MFWYSSLAEVHLYLAYASVIFFTLRALGVVFNIDLLKDGRTKVLSFGVDVPLTMTGISLWYQLGANPLYEPWLAMKFIYLAAYIALGALALRAKTREGELLALLLALLSMGLLFGVATTKDPWMGLR